MNPSVISRTKRKRRRFQQREKKVITVYITPTKKDASCILKERWNVQDSGNATERRDGRS